MTKTMTEKLREATYSYIGRLVCGCVVAAVVDTQDKETGKCVADFVKDGLTIERVEHEYVRQNLTFRCPHGNNDPKPKRPTKKTVQPSLF